jgi:MFS family permease
MSDLPTASRHSRDRALLLSAAFLRALGTGMIGVLLGFYLATLSMSPAQIGLIVSLGLWGMAAGALLTTLRADRFGRRRTLIMISLLTAAGGAVVALASSPVVIAVAAFLGMMNGMGRDRGAALIVDQVVLPTTTDDAGRTRAFAWYNLLQDVGHALGSLGAGVPTLLQHAAGATPLGALRVAVLIYAGIMLATGVLYAALTPAVEGSGNAVPRGIASLSPESRRIITRISALFALDGLGGGFLTASLLSFFFFKRFGATPAVVGWLFFAARVANAFSHLGAAWLAKRIGLVNTMVFTHIPSSILLATVPFAPSFTIAAVLFIIREGLVEMDVPTRQSYVVAVVRPEERTAASGVTGLVRLGAWAVAPAFAGLVMKGGGLGAPLALGAAMKITYDVMLYFAFRRVKPPEERAAA